MTLKILPIAVALCGLATPSLATEWIVCDSADGKAGISLLAGEAAVLSIGRLNLHLGKKNWSTNPDLEPGSPVVLGQSYADKEEMLVDILDSQFSEIVAQLRVFSIEDDAGIVQGGVLKIDGHAFAVSCEGG